MEEQLAGIPDWFITTLIGLIGFTVYYVWKSSQGLGEAQLAKQQAVDATHDESDRVIDLQEKRIALLEKEVAMLTMENEQLWRRVRRLEAQRDGEEDV